MRVLIVGTGGVGEAIALITQKRDPKAEWMEKMILSDYNFKRAREVALKLNEKDRFIPEKIDASSKDDVIALAKKYRVDVILNAVDPRFNMAIFNAAFEAGCNYIDMALSLSEKHPVDPYRKCNIKLGDKQFEQAKRWEDKGLLALLGCGVEPGMSDVFARYAEKHLFDEIEEIGVRDGDNFTAEGYDIFFGFSIWTSIEECLNPPIIWEKDKGWYTTEPFSEPEVFQLPGSIGEVEMVNVEHEEVVLIPRYINKGLRRVTFKFGLGDEMIQLLKNLQALNLDKKEKILTIGNTKIAPRDIVSSLAPDPAKIGGKIHGQISAGTWIKGKKDGLERQVYIYQLSDNDECMETVGAQAVVAQTAFNPVIALELMEKGVWEGCGVHGPEAFDPDPFVDLMKEYGFPGGIREMESEYLRKQEEQLL